MSYSSVGRHGIHAMQKNDSQRWKRFKQSTPGQRFQQYFKRRQQTRPSPMWRLLFVSISILVMAVGLLLLAVPGPGIVVFVVGATILARESLTTARILDWSELRLRSLACKCIKWWRRR